VLCDCLAARAHSVNPPYNSGLSLLSTQAATAAAVTAASEPRLAATETYTGSRALQLTPEQSEVHSYIQNRQQNRAVEVCVQLRRATLARKTPHRLKISLSVETEAEFSGLKMCKMGHRALRHTVFTSFYISVIYLYMKTHSF